MGVDNKDDTYPPPLVSNPCPPPSARGANTHKETISLYKLRMLGAVATHS